MNTKISYMYRDASNYKAHREIVVKGKLTLEQLQPCLYEGEFFIPEKVGLEELQHELTSFPSEDDHVWHTICSVEPTTEEALDGVASTLRGRFLHAKKIGWNVLKASERLGIY
jgi:hypothetical protein